MTFTTFQEKLMAKIKTALTAYKAETFYIEEDDYIEFKFQYGSLVVYGGALEFLSALNIFSIENFEETLDELSVNHIYDLLREDKNSLIIDYKGFAKTVNETNVQIDGIDFSLPIDFTQRVKDLSVTKCVFTLSIGEERKIITIG